MAKVTREGAHKPIYLNSYLIRGDYIQCSTRNGVDFLLSLEDEWILQEYSFYASKRSSGGFYIRTTYQGCKLYFHRIIMSAKKGEQVDHINGDTLDNRRENLRTVTPFENCHGFRSAKSSTGLLGVSEHSDGGFIGRKSVRGKTYCTKVYETAQEAKIELWKIISKLKVEGIL